MRHHPKTPLGTALRVALLMMRRNHPCETRVLDEDTAPSYIVRAMRLFNKSVLFSFIILGYVRETRFFKIICVSPSLLSAQCKQTDLVP